MIIKIKNKILQLSHGFLMEPIDSPISPGVKITYPSVSYVIIIKFIHGDFTQTFIEEIFDKYGVGKNTKHDFSKWNEKITNITIKKI